MIFANMKSLFSRSMSSKRLVVVTTSFVVFVTVLGIITFETTKKTVAMTIDGKKKVIKTHADTVGDILEDLKINLRSKDYLSLSADTKVVDRLSFVWEPANEVKIKVGDKERMIWTTADTVEELLEDENMQLSKYDKVKPSMNEAINKNMKIEIAKAFSLTLNDGGKKKKVWSTSTTVADFLKQQEIKLNELDRTKPDLKQKVKPDDEVKVIRIKKVTDVVEEPIDFAVVTKKDSKLIKGNEKVIQYGQKGLVRKKYEITKENGTEVERKLLNEETIKESKEKIVAVGTKVLTAQVSRGSADNGVEYYVSSTAYTANCNGCSGQTATGIDLRANPNIKIIAVDPSFIPLGSKVYVEGYGYAVAADTGGSVRGNKIDVFFSSKSSAYRWGSRRVKIRIIK